MPGAGERVGEGGSAGGRSGARCPDGAASLDGATDDSEEAEGGGADGGGVGG
ncbi:hypothetical protein ACFRK5_18320 [Streptomyces niveus]|uniref:hypothetical protein n=1 Tax=Streptomyces niveus TaxID=193462 RepID=UPI0036805C92